MSAALAVMLAATGPFGGSRPIEVILAGAAFLQFVVVRVGRSGRPSPYVVRFSAVILPAEALTVRRCSASTPSSVGA